MGVVVLESMVISEWQRYRYVANERKIIYILDILLSIMKNLSIYMIECYVTSLWRVGAT